MKAGKLFKAYLRQSFQKFNVITGILLVFLLSSVILYAGQLTSSLFTFSDGTIASASEVNSNFQLLSNAVDANRDGFACEMTSEGSITATPVDFVCESMIADYASYSGTYLFETSESGVYQIHRSILVSFSSTGAATVNTLHNTIYIDGTSIDDANREYYSLNSGQYIEIKFVHSTDTDYWHRSGSMVFVKRIF